MDLLDINIGTGPNTRTGDTAYVFSQKINTNNGRVKAAIEAVQQATASGVTDNYETLAALTASGDTSTSKRFNVFGDTTAINNGLYIYFGGVYEKYANNLILADEFDENDAARVVSAKQVNDRITARIDEMDVVTASANLLDPDIIISGSYYRNSDGVVVAGAAYLRTPLIQLQPNTQYTISGINSNLPGGLYNSDGSVRDSQIAPYLLAGYTEVTFTTGDEGVANYLGLNVSSVEDTAPGSVTEIMLALGTNTTYEPYGEYTIKGPKVKGDIADYPTAAEVENVIFESGVNTASMGVLVANYYAYGGTSFKTLPQSTILSVAGDYLEITANCKDSTSNKGLGLTGTSKASNIFTNIVGFYSNNQFTIRTTSGYLIWDLPARFDIVTFRTYKVLVVDVASTLYWRLSVDGEIIGDIAKVANLTINGIGNTYYNQSFIGGVRSLKLHNASYDFDSTDMSGTNTVLNVVKTADDALTKVAQHNVYVSYKQATITTTVANEELQGNFYIYVKYAGQSNLYARYQVAHVVHVEKRADNWRIYRADLFKLVDGIMIDQEINLLTTGDSECVFQENGKSDATGGFHGDETYDTVFFYIDGKKITDLATDFDLVGCDNFRYEQVSEIIETDNETDTPRCTHKKITTFSDAGYTTKNGLTWLSVPATISIWYSGISCVALAQTAEYNSEFLNYYTFSGANNATLNEARSRKVYYRGNVLPNHGYAIAAVAEGKVTYATESLTEVTEAYDLGAKNIVYEDATTRAKYYREVLNKNPIIGDVWESEFTLKHFEI